MTSADPLKGFEREKVGRIKEQLARRKYRVDSEAVAQEILFKARMLRLSRRTLLGEPPESGGPAIPQPGGK
jgi:hypothetical protein